MMVLAAVFYVLLRGVYARTIIFSLHSVTTFQSAPAALEAAQKLFTNKWDRVVITLDRNYETRKETFSVEGFRRESTLTE